MEGAGSGFNPNSAFGSVSDNAMDVDFMDELLFDGCWLETAPSQHFSSESNTNRLSINLSQQVYREETPKNFLQNLPSVSPKVEELVGTQEWKVTQNSKPTSQSESFLLEGTEVGNRLWIGPSTSPRSSSSVKDRLKLAIAYLKNWMRDRDFLIQIWVPIKEGGKQVLTTKGQPYSLDLNCKSLVSYRGVSSTYRFPTDEGLKELTGLPGRVFLEKLPEWTPDVRFFRKEEYPRIDYAQQYDVRGSIALPVFERGSGSCLGVVEFVTTIQKPNYRPELENVCKALEAVDLMSFHNVNSPKMKAPSEKYQAALPGIVEVLASVGKMYQLPLAQTWRPCIQQGKDGCRHSNENYTFCVSTVDSACFVADSELLDFHEACSEHHLFQGQGLVGRAFSTNKPVFSSDVTAFPKTRYPLSHHARMYGLHAAAAIPLQSIHPGSADLVLEFFLPKDCQDIEQQKQILNSLLTLIQQSCQTLHALVGKEFEGKVVTPAWEMVAASNGTFDGEANQQSVHLEELSAEKPSWIAHLIQSEHKGKGVSISVESQKEPNEKFKLTAHWDEGQKESHHEALFLEHSQFLQDSLTKASTEVYQGSSVNGHCSPGSRNSGEKRRTKIEKTISLEVLRQYFAGSLKDAAKGIGVCPTTLKRICRQHGITRWPSRKIKKVGHSLRKLQLVIDSVQGAEGAIQIGSFYKSFPELSSPNLSGTGPFSLPNMNDHSNKTNPEAKDGLGGQVVTTSKSRSSSGSQSTGSSTCSSTRAEQQTTTGNVSTNGEKDNSGLLSDAELKVLNQEGSNLLSGIESHKLISNPPSHGNLSSLPKCNGQSCRDGSGFRVKATFGDEKVRFTLQSTWKFRDLQQEISRRFNIDEANEIDLKYLDDEHEWVLLTCDADLEECIDIYKSSQSRTIKLSLFRASRTGTRGLFGAKTST